MTLPAFDPRYTTTPTQWAWFYRSLGWQVVPCWRPGEPPHNAAWKRPKLAWKQFQTQLVAPPIFERWYPPRGVGGEFSDRWNMGVITGSCSGNLFITDLDSHKTPEALAWWRGVLAYHNNNMALETPTQRTGGGGQQLVFLAPPGVVMPTCRTPIGVDIRGEAGFAVLAPSFHDSGSPYAWHDGLAPWEIEVMEAPDWLLQEINELCRRYGNVRVSDPGDDTWAAPAPAAARTASPAAEYSVTGLRVDGREQLMRDICWHGVLELYRTSPVRPHEAHWEREAQPVFERYVRAVLTRLPGAGTEDAQRAGLEREGRGWSLFWYKWQRDMRRWGDVGFVAAAAKSNPRRAAPEPDRGATPPPADGGSRPPGSPGVPPRAEAVPSTGQTAGLVLYDAGVDYGTVPPREWLLGNQFCRQYISSVIGSGGTGKTALRIAQFLALASGRQLIPSQHVFARTRVLLISLEDDATELRRRIEAARLHYGLPREELAGWLMYCAPSLQKLARTDEQTGLRVRGELERLIRATLEAAIVAGQPFGLLALDPFVKTHALEENSSGDMDFVCTLMAQLALDYNIAVDCSHHSRKGKIEPGDADAGRGSTGIRDAARLVFTLCPMSKEEAEEFDIAKEERRSYVRLDPAKLNGVATLEQAQWFKLESQPLGNATDRYPNGDAVQVAVPWTPPSARDLPYEILNQMLDRIKAGIDTPMGRRRYSNAPAAVDRAAWKVIAEVGGLKQKQATRIINQWLNTGLLYAEPYKDPLDRRAVSGLFVRDEMRPGRLVEKVTLNGSA